MAYRDSEKQKESNRLAAKKRREKLKGMTQGMTQSEGMTVGMTVVKCESGGYITLDKFVDDGWVELMRYLVKHVKPESRERICVGVGGGTLGEYMKIADVVGVV